ncbi:hypothetical protein GDO78_019374 [Eleutherodactylus coqui]|uniref:Taste receptor type 2 n=1 Tax=Eleutherodactylus coqui TaxID=57060 RepID=A0A8J6BGW3_ELECQ|nr:hypothetical protein GDO78_019374 [Eleutherodactylus coqui]
MGSALNIAVDIIVGVTGVSGTFLNAIIVVLNFSFWRDVTTTESYNKILFFIGLINLLLQGQIMFNAIFQSFDFYVSSNNLLLYMITLGYTLISTNIWNTTWLSIFCCVRLVNCSHIFFVKIQVKFFSSLPLLLVGSVLLCAITNLPLLLTNIRDIPLNTTDFSESNFRFIVNYYCITLSSLFGFIIPFFMTFVSIGLNVTTLLRHIRRMGSSDSHLTSVQLQGHYRAVRTMVIRVFLDFLFFFSTFLGISFPFILDSITRFVVQIIFLTYPTCQAFILIFGNPKLKGAVYGLFKALR